MTTAPHGSAPRAHGSGEDRPATGAAPGGQHPGGQQLRWLARALVVAGLGMVPWLVLLAVCLPARTVAYHWSAAWVGLDTMETAGLLITGALLLLRDRRSCLAATVTATLVFTDAWFDVTTSAPGLAQLTAVAMAAFIEVPVSVLCAVLALRLVSAHRMSSRW